MSHENASISASSDAVALRQLEWSYDDKVRLDDTVVFGIGYDFFGLESLRLEAKGPNGNYLMWPNSGRWSLYRDTDGALAFESYSSREECEQAAEDWCNDPPQQ